MNYSNGKENPREHGLVSIARMTFVRRINRNFESLVYVDIDLEWKEIVVSSTTADDVLVKILYSKKLELKGFSSITFFFKFYALKNILNIFFPFLLKTLSGKYRNIQLKLKLENKVKKYWFFQMGREMQEIEFIRWGHPLVQRKITFLGITRSPIICRVP